MEAHQFPEVEPPNGVDADDEVFQSFVDAAQDSIVQKLERNRQHVNDDEPTVQELLSPENIDHLDVRAHRFENTKVTLWMKSSACPIWANDVWGDTIYPKGLNAYNGKVHVHVTFDVRPF